MNIFIDFLGYYPKTLYLCCIEPNKWLYDSYDLETIKVKGRAEGWVFIPNPRFKDFPKHLEMVTELNS